MKLAIVGLGWWGKQIIAALAPSTRLTVVCGVDPAAPGGTAEFLAAHGIRLEPEFDRMLRDPVIDGVVIATPHALHEEQVLAAIAAGKQVFCEKPVAMSAEGARRIAGACAAKGLVLGVGHERRYEPAFRALVAMVEAGKLGRLLHLDANVSHDLFRKLDAANWRLKAQDAPAAMMTAVGIHVTDLFVRLAGPVNEVQAETASLVFAPPAEDFVSARFSFINGARGSLTCLSATPFYGRVTVYGDAGWVEIVSEGNVDQGKPTIMTVATATGEPRLVRQFAATDTVIENFEAWAAAVDGGAAYDFTAAQILANSELLEAIVRSAARSGERIVIGAIGAP
ncbi:Gfo/Idh/MocA family protein [Phreatobacter stygius]|nr:Gfo/Idh/MocA family oxidoreductase [Phreatobacter stygius]